jgi:hypothetical protein
MYKYPKSPKRKYPQNKVYYPHIEKRIFSRIMVRISVKASSLEDIFPFQMEHWLESITNQRCLVKTKSITYRFNQPYKVYNISAQISNLRDQEEFFKRYFIEHYPKYKGKIWKEWEKKNYQIDRKEAFLFAEDTSLAFRHQLPKHDIFYGEFDQRNFNAQISFYMHPLILRMDGVKIRKREVHEHVPMEFLALSKFISTPDSMQLTSERNLLKACFGELMIKTMEAKEKTACVQRRVEKTKMLIEKALFSVTSIHSMKFR